MPQVLPFPRLPEELVKLVFECACEPINLQSSSAVPADTSTLLSLLLVSRATYNLLIPRLYRTITISKPSQLIDFTSTLLHRPALGLLVRNLWVGVVDAPLHNLPIIVSSNVHFSRAAQNHIVRHERETNNQKNIDPTKPDLISYQRCNDLVYLEDGIEFAAMHVQSKTTQMAQPNPPLLQQYGLEYFNNRDAWSSTSATSFGGFGVDRESAGYDAAGDWIGMDEWILRCIELQNMTEFHWEWVAATCSKQEIDRSGDDEARANDPMDWADVNEAPAPLPSVTRMDNPAASTPTSPSASSKLGFDHILRFALLRQRGHSPRSAALIIIENHLQKTHLPGQHTPQHSTIELLHDSSETDHFAHPALYARSGCIELLIGCEPPEGENAPPNAIPASSAVFSAFGGMTYGSDDDSDSEDEDLSSHHANGTNINLEGRQRERERHALDFADLFGHVSHDSRSLYAGMVDKPPVIEHNMRDGFQTSSVMAKWKLQEPREWSRPLPTLGSLIATMRSCLSFCPRVRVLGVNGFLERTVGGTRECVGLSELRHLCLGPAPPFWSSALHLHQKMLSNVRTMHISGCMLYRSEAMAIGGYTNALPNLREFDWTLWLGHVGEHPITVIDALSYMLGHTPASANSNTSQGEVVKRKRLLKTVRATLNPTDVVYWEQNATEEARKDRRLALHEINIKEQDANIRSVRDWWERKSSIR